MCSSLSRLSNNGRLPLSPLHVFVYHAILRGRWRYGRSNWRCYGNPDFFSESPPSLILGLFMGVSGLRTHLGGMNFAARYVVTRISLSSSPSSATPSSIMHRPTPSVPSATSTITPRPAGAHYHCCNYQVTMCWLQPELQGVPHTGRERRRGHRFRPVSHIFSAYCCSSNKATTASLATTIAPTTMNTPHVVMYASSPVIATLQPSNLFGLGFSSLDFVKDTLNDYVPPSGTHSLDI